MSVQSPQQSDDQATSSGPLRGTTRKAAGWRLLHVEPNDIDAMKVKLALQYDLPPDSRLLQVTSYAEATERLESGPWDVVLVGHFELADHGRDELRQFVATNPKVPVLVLSADDDPQVALAAGKCGAREYLLKSKLTGEALSQAIASVVRSTDDSQQADTADRRKHPRYPLALSAVVFPILSDGRPGREVPATTLDISHGGISVLAEASADQLPDVCLVGVECPDGPYRYAAVEWRWRRLALPAVRFGGRFLSRADDPFHPTQLTPRFDPGKLQYVPPMDPVVLSEWTSRGILRPRTIDRLLSCPDCRSLPTFRNGCGKCGSANTRQDKLIHHFACAVVAPVEEFEADGLTCPKCQAKHLVVGADFEYLAGSHRCDECDWTGSELELIGECMKCGRRFGGNNALERDVVEYYVPRLEPAALIDTASSAGA